MREHQSQLNAGAWSNATPRREQAPAVNPDAPVVNDQLVIAYGRGRATRVYCTVYSPTQAPAALARCVAAHGQWVCARLVHSRSGDPAAL